MDNSSLNFNCLKLFPSASYHLRFFLWPSQLPNYPQSHSLPQKPKLKEILAYTAHQQEEDSERDQHLVWDGRPKAAAENSHFSFIPSLERARILFSWNHCATLSSLLCCQPSDRLVPFAAQLRTARYISRCKAISKEFDKTIKNELWLRSLTLSFRSLHLHTFCFGTISYTFSAKFIGPVLACVKPIFVTNEKLSDYASAASGVSQPEPDLSAQLQAPAENGFGASLHGRVHISSAFPIKKLVRRAQKFVW